MKIEKINFIAEISSNHNKSLNRTLKLIKSAKDSGFTSVKFQLFKINQLFSKEILASSFQHRSRAKWELPINFIPKISQYCKKINIKFGCTPFYLGAVKELAPYVDFFKISSYELLWNELLIECAKTKKPLIISTGMANLKEIDLAYNTAKNNGSKEIILLYCVSNYPSKISDFNLNNIKILQDRYNCIIGFSDHSTDNKVVAAAVAAGAKVIEKHIAFQGQTKGFDIAFSLKGKEIKNYLQVIKETSIMMGKEKFFRSGGEKKNLKFRRSIYSTSDIKKGEKFSKKNIKVIRPGFGIQPAYYERLLNKKSPFNIGKAKPIKKNLLKKLKIFI